MKGPNIYFSSIEYRPNPLTSEGSMPLGLLLEFMLPQYWVVGLGVRAALPLEAIGLLDPMSRELIENRADLIVNDVDDALQKAMRPGDVLSLLSKNNPWSIHVTEPRTLVVEPQAVERIQSVDQAVDEFIVKVYRKTLEVGKPVVAGRSSWLAHFKSKEPVPPPEVSAMQTPWISQTRHWMRPLVGASAR